MSYRTNNMLAHHIDWHIRTASFISTHKIFICHDWYTINTEIGIWQQIFFFFSLFERRIHSGWSTNKSTVPLNASERERIIEVIQRNELLEDAERQRVGKIIERVERIKQRASDCGPKNCRWESNLCLAVGFLCDSRDSAGNAELKS